MHNAAIAELQKANGVAGVNMLDNLIKVARRRIPIAPDFNPNPVVCHSPPLPRTIPSQRVLRLRPHRRSQRMSKRQLVVIWIGHMKISLAQDASRWQFGRRRSFGEGQDASLAEGRCGSPCLRARRAARRPITPREERVHLCYDRGPLPDSCPHSLHRAATHVANGEDAFDPGLQR